MEKVECGVRRAVEVRRTEEVPEREHTAEEGQDRKVRFAEEEQSAEMRAQRTKEPDATCGLEEVRAGRGGVGHVRGG